MATIRAILIALACCTSICHAQCTPPTKPASERVRIVECTDGSYALETYERGDWESLEICGLDIGRAREQKMMYIVALDLLEKQACPPQPKYPAVVVK